MKRKLIALFCVLTLLWGCTPVRTNEGTAWQIQPSPGEAAAPQPLPQPRGDTRNVSFAVSQKAPEILRAAATYFCKELSEISQGSLSMTLLETPSPQAALEDGTAQVAFLTDKKELAFSRPLEATASPFLYTGYRNFTMRVNAAETLSLLERFLRENDGLVPLAAYYQGSRHFLATIPITSYLHMEGAVIAMEEDPQMAESLARLGAKTQATASAQERFSLYASGEVTGIEVTLAELAAQAELPVDSYLMISGHNTTPAWLMAQADFYDSLTPAQQAGVKELCAYMINLIDDQQVEQEQQMMEQINFSNLGYLTEFSNVRNRVFNTLGPLDSEALAPQVVARDLVNMMRRIT